MNATGCSTLQVCQLDRIKNAISARLHDLFDQVLATPERYVDQVVRLEIEVERHLQPLIWLEAQPQPVKVYWTDREETVEIAGVGSADQVFDQEAGPIDGLCRRLRQYLAPETDQTRYFGGLRFNSHRPLEKRESGWHEFGQFWFILPLFELIHTGRENRFACNILIKSGDDPQQVLDRILTEFDRITFDQIDPAPADFFLLTREDQPRHEDWQARMNQMLDDIAGAALAKVVPARKASFEFLESLPTLKVMTCLRLANTDCFHFYLQPTEQVAFLGSTPERLYKRQGRLLLTEAVAGTRIRGKTPVEDERLGHDLLTSNKDIREQQLVIDFLQENLAPLCHNLEYEDTPSLLRLSRLQHLSSRFNGELRPDVRDDDIIRAIHPTPAVCGYPLEPALDLISRMEKFDRGFYAGPVGWVSADSAEFAVAIRSGLIRDKWLTLYAGAGVVEGSQSESEWDEIENKLNNFLSILDITTL